MNLHEAIAKSLILRSDGFNSFKYKDIEEFISNTFSLSSESEELRVNNFCLVLESAKYALIFDQLDYCLKFILSGRHLTKNLIEVTDFELVALECFMKKGDRKLALAKLKLLNENVNGILDTQKMKLSKLRKYILKGSK